MRSSFLAHASVTGGWQAVWQLKSLPGLALFASVKLLPTVDWWGTVRTWPGSLRCTANLLAAMQILGRQLLQCLFLSGKLYPHQVSVTCYFREWSPCSYFLPPHTLKEKHAAAPTAGILCFSLSFFCAWEQFTKDFTFKTKCHHYLILTECVALWISLQVHFKLTSFQECLAKSRPYGGGEPRLAAPEDSFTLRVPQGLTSYRCSVETRTQSQLWITWGSTCEHLKITIVANRASAGRHQGQLYIPFIFTGAWVWTPGLTLAR
jgi:hypothetical protein